LEGCGDGVIEPFSWLFLGGTEEDNEKPQSEWLVFQLRFKVSTSQIKSRALPLCQLVWCTADNEMKFD
jgi:hypothetical protein